jgi:hypothetical protein
MSKITCLRGMARFLRPSNYLSARQAKAEVKVKQMIRKIPCQDSSVSLNLNLDLDLSLS